jgi:cell division septum initiation protein DivIVA
MANEQLLISGIEYKIRKLIEINEALSNENKVLKQKVSELTNKVSALSGSLLEEENKKIKLSLANTLEYKIGVEKGKEKLDELIEEIDKCINVLSD